EPEVSAEGCSNPQRAQVEDTVVGTGTVQRGPRAVDQFGTRQLFEGNRESPPFLTTRKNRLAWIAAVDQHQNPAVGAPTKTTQVEVVVVQPTLGEFDAWRPGQKPWSRTEGRLASNFFVTEGGHRCRSVDDPLRRTRGCAYC